MEPIAKPICGFWGEELLTVRKTANYQNKFTSDKISFMEWPDKRLCMFGCSKRKRIHFTKKEIFRQK